MRWVRGEQLVFEAMATRVRHLGGLSDDDDLGLMATVAARLFGPHAIVLDPLLLGAAYLRHRPPDRFQIVINPAARDLRFHFAHELGEWALIQEGFVGSEADRERAANLIGAAILAPRRALRRAHRDLGERLREIATRFQMSQTAVVLRLAEVIGDERAVVTKTGNVLLRTQGAFPWANVPVVDVARGQSRWRGLAKAPLRGGIDEGRIALRAR